MEQMANPHTADEIAGLSTVAHNVIGWLLAAIAVAMLWETARKPAEGRWRLLWPALGMTLGLGLSGFVSLHFIFYHRVSPFLDPAQNQHQIIGILAGTGATAELIRRVRRSEHQGFKLVWPASLVAIGTAFLIHEQGTTEALLIHWALAATFIVAGLALSSVFIAGEPSRAVTSFGVLLLATAAVQLIVFTEKPGAHGAHEQKAQARSGHEEPPKDAPASPHGAH